MEQITEYAMRYGQIALDYLTQESILIQIGLIAVLFLPAWLASKRVEPILEERARRIKGMPGLLRVIVAFLRRFEWLFFVLLLAFAYVITTATAWPANNRLIYAVMLLSGAWLAISVVSHVIRSRALGKLFAWIAWVYVAATFFGVVDDAAELLDSAGFSMGEFRLSILVILKAAILLSVLLWASSAFGNPSMNAMISSGELP